MYKLHLKTAMRSINGYRLRSLLTITGVAIGVGLLACLVTVGQGARKQILGQIDGLGSNLLYVVSSNNFILSNFQAATLTDEDYETTRTAPDAQETAAVRYLAGGVTFNGRVAETNLVAATTANYKSVRDSRIAKGDYFTSSDEKQKLNVAVIGPSTEQKLFGGQSALGQSVIFNDVPYRVVGVFEPAVPGSELTVGGGFDDVLFIPLATYRSQQSTGNNLLSVIITKMQSSTDKKRFKSTLQKRISTTHAGQSFSVIANDDLLSTSETVVSIVTSLIAIVAAASILVGGIGILNIMLVSVSERTREIGIRKTMGASNKDILLQFLFESTILSTIGGLMGIILSLIASQIIAFAFDISPVYSVMIFMAGTVLSILTGILFGISPAIRASKLNPIQALKQLDQ